MTARRALLQEKGVTWRSHWGDVKPLIADDPRCAAMPRGDRDVYFRKYRDELEVRPLASRRGRGLPQHALTSQGAEAGAQPQPHSNRVWSVVLVCSKAVGRVGITEVRRPLYHLGVNATGEGLMPALVIIEVRASAWRDGYANPDPALQPLP